MEVERKIVCRIERIEILFSEGKVYFYSNSSTPPIVCEMTDELEKALKNLLLSDTNITVKKE